MNRQKGVMKVVSLALSGLRTIWWRLELASSLENADPSVRLPSVSSKLGIWYTSRGTAWLRLVRSTYSRTFPLAFGTTTMGEHQSVGLSTGSLTSSYSMRCSSSFTFFMRGNGTRLGVVTQNDVTPSFRRIVYSPSSLPRPRKSIGYCFTMFFFTSGRSGKSEERVWSTGLTL